MRAHLLLIAVVLLAFGASLGSGFHFDDYAIFADRALTSTAGWREVWRLEQTRPLTYLTFWLNYQVSGRNPLGYHALNLLLHAAAALLLYGCLRRLLPATVSLAAAAMFAAHPIQSEAVIYIWARSILLATVFCLLALRAWLKGRHWAAVGWFAAALLSKEECAAFPLLLLAFDRKQWKPAAAMIGLAAAAAVRVVYAAAVTPGAPIAQQAGIGPFDYLLAQGITVLRYLRLVIAPWGFTVDPDIRVPAVWIGLAAWSAVGAAAWLAWKRYSLEGKWILFGLVLLIPSSSIFPAADLAADRRMYLPMTVLAVALVLALRRWKPAPWIVCALLALASIGRTQIWSTERSLWREAVERAPGKLRPKLQLARALPTAEALPILADARRLAPDDPNVAAQTGAVLLESGDPAAALGEFGRALALAPSDARNHNNRGIALAALGQRDAARQDFRRALELDPALDTARDNLARLGAN